MVDQVVSHLDLPATLLLAAGASSQVVSSASLDGEALELAGGGARTRSKPLLWMRGSQQYIVMIDGDWKLFMVRGQATALYNLASDPGEVSDQRSNQQVLTASMRDAARTWASYLPDPPTWA